MNEKMELKPCPFCGEKPHMMKTICDNGYVSFHVRHRCRGRMREIMTEICSSEKEAAHYWNRRMEK